MSGVVRVLIGTVIFYQLDVGSSRADTISHSRFSIAGKPNKIHLLKSHRVYSSWESVWHPGNGSCDAWWMWASIKTLSPATRNKPGFTGSSPMGSNLALLCLTSPPCKVMVAFLALPMHLWHTLVYSTCDIHFSFLVSSYWWVSVPLMCFTGEPHTGV